MAASRTSRPAGSGLTNSASALVALVTLAAMISGATAATQRVADSRPVITEAQAVRAVAAAVVRAARELVGHDRIDAALPTRDARLLAAIIPGALAPAPIERSARLLAAPRIGERLLNLPPPVC